MEVFDLGLAYVWEYDDGFLELIERTLQNTGFSTFILSYHNIHEVRDRIINRKLAFNFYIDRAWDEIYPLAIEEACKIFRCSEHRAHEIFQKVKDIPRC